MALADREPGHAGAVTWGDNRGMDELPEARPCRIAVAAGRALQSHDAVIVLDRALQRDHAQRSGRQRSADHAVRHARRAAAQRPGVQGTWFSDGHGAQPGVSACVIAGQVASQEGGRWPGVGGSECDQLEDFRYRSGDAVRDVGV